MGELLLCGATGDLGGRIAARLVERRIPFRALVRPRSDAAALRSSGVEVSVGDLTDPAGLDRALDGVRTVVTTANGMGRNLAGARDVSIERVDRDGNAALVRAAEAAGVERFVFVSSQGLTDAMVDLVPLLAAKRATERLLQASSVRSVLVRPAAFQETWLGPESGIRPEKRLAVIPGRGRTPVPYVAEDDVAEACVRLATMDDPPEALDLGGPEALTRHEVVDAFERELGVRMRRVAVPRRVLAFGAGAGRSSPRPWASRCTGTWARRGAWRGCGRSASSRAPHRPTSPPWRGRPSAPDPAQPSVPVAAGSWSANLRRASSSASTAFPRRSQPRVSADLSGARAS